MKSLTFRLFLQQYCVGYVFAFFLTMEGELGNMYNLNFGNNQSIHLEVFIQ